MRALVVLAVVARVAVAQAPGDSAKRVDSARHLDMAAQNLARAHMYPQALGLWVQAAQINPADYTAHFDAGMMYEITRHAPEALHEFQAAYALRPDPQLLYHLGVSFHNTGMRDSALRWFLAATAQNERDVPSWGYAGYTASELGRDSEAVAYWQKALALYPKYFDQVEPEQRPRYQHSLGVVAARDSMRMH